MDKECLIKEENVLLLETCRRHEAIQAIQAKWIPPTNRNRNTTAALSKRLTPALPESFHSCKGLIRKSRKGITM